MANVNMRVLVIVYFDYIMYILCILSRLMHIRVYMFCYT